jgi:integrase
MGVTTPADLFASPLATELREFLAFKRARGCVYQRAEYTLLSFDRFVVRRGEVGAETALSALILAWFASMDGRKAVSVAFEMSVMRQFCLFLRRRDPSSFVPSRAWAPQSTESSFLPHLFTEQEIRILIESAAKLRHAPLRPAATRAMILMLYCTGLRLGEAIRMRGADVDLDNAVFFVRESKGRSRFVPFGRDLANELNVYLEVRTRVLGDAPYTHFLVQPDGRPISILSASCTLRRMMRQAGFKPPRGREGPRPYDLRHTFAVERLTRWHREGADVNARLPWLSAYMGHYDLLGTESYLRATPELLALASDRFEARFKREGGTS